MDISVTGSRKYSGARICTIRPCALASVQGKITALNNVLTRTVYQHQEEGGTIVGPGHGYMCDEHEVVEYRDMVVKEFVDVMAPAQTSISRAGAEGFA
jgi:hypothetical protein